MLSTRNYKKNVSYKADVKVISAINNKVHRAAKCKFE